MSSFSLLSLLAYKCVDIRENLKNTEKAKEVIFDPIIYRLCVWSQYGVTGILYALVIH